LDAWLGAAASGDAAQVAAVMAPEFQLVRSDGSAYGAKEYLAGGMPQVTGTPKVESLVATGYGDHLVARYELIIESTLANGKTMEERAPRMTVFRKSGDTWLVVSHANFAALH
jgi:ketosteroid isomerase-like protein